MDFIGKIGNFIIDYRHLIGYACVAIILVLAFFLLYKYLKGRKRNREDIEGIKSMLTDISSDIKKMSNTPSVYIDNRNSGINGEGSEYKPEAGDCPGMRIAPQEEKANAERENHSADDQRKDEPPKGGINEDEIKQDDTNHAKLDKTYEIDEIAQAKLDEAVETNETYETDDIHEAEEESLDTAEGNLDTSEGLRDLIARLSAREEEAGNQHTDIPNSPNQDGLNNFYRKYTSRVDSINKQGESFTAQELREKIIY